MAGNNALAEATEIADTVAPQPLASSGSFPCVPAPSAETETESEAAPPTAAPEAEAAPPTAAPATLVIEEHRASPRVSLSVDIHMSSDSHFFTGLSGDISEGGIFVSTYRPLAIGDEVELELTLPGSADPFTARGTVRWIREHSADHPRGFGISFDVLADGERARIHDFCARRPPLYYELD